MKILLLNDNPVVTKLVTLSAQKTDDEVEIVTDIDSISSDMYDLLIVDDGLFSNDVLNAIKEKIKFRNSLFICSRESEKQDEFTKTIKKPFLPTDMVELFSSLKKNLDSVDEDISLQTQEPTDIESDDLENGDVLEGLDDLEELGDLESLDDDLDIGDDLDLDDLEEGLGESVLDDEEAQKVKDLLDDAELTDEEMADEEYDIALDLEDEADVNISEDEDLASDEDVIDEDTAELGELNVATEDLDSLLDEELADEELSFDEEVDLDLEELNLEDENLENQIEDAMSELSEEDLESEVDENTLLEIANHEMDSFANLNSKELKLALGEEVDESEDELLEESTEEEEASIAEPTTTNAGVEGLQALLNALKDKNVAASMKGAKITINISFEGDE